MARITVFLVVIVYMSWHSARGEGGVGVRGWVFPNHLFHPPHPLYFTSVPFLACTLGSGQGVRAGGAWEDMGGQVNVWAHLRLCPR